MNVPLITVDTIERLTREVFGEPNRRLSTVRDLRFGARGSVCVRRDTGAWFDHEHGAGGGVRDLAKLAGSTELYGFSVRTSQARQPSPCPRQSEEQRKAKAERLWASTRPLAGSVAERYLRQTRAISAPLDGAELAFLPGRGDYPSALAAMVMDVRERPLGVHLTGLKPEGSGRLERKMIGPVGAGRGHIQLIPGSPVVVAEGLESAFSAWEALSDPTAGCVAAMSAGGMAQLAWPEDTEFLVIAPDRDRAGMRAAEGLASRACAIGLAVGFLWPPEDCDDWNEWAQRNRP